LRRVVPRPEVLLFTRKIRFVSETSRCLRHDQKACKSFCTSTVVVFSDPLSSTPTFSTTKTPGNTKVDLDNPELADEVDIQMECTSH
jgi:peroxiredoxin